MEKISVFRWLLFPITFLYGVIGWLRNKLYDWNILKSTSFEGVRLIGVGNLSSGGTGKTPHVEYLVRQLKDTYNVAVVSRGYKRKTKGFVLADAKSTALEIGDEPMQMYRKFAKDGVEVAVGEKRVKAVRKLLQLKPDIEVIVLDDVFQHRAIAVDTLILLTDFNHLFTEDYVLPMGSLREFQRGYQRADMIVVTKCPKRLNALEKLEIIAAIYPLPHQKLTFSFLKYQQPYAFVDKSVKLNWKRKKVDAVLVVCGIAKPERVVEYVLALPKMNSWATDGEDKLETLFFDDHHDFSVADLEQIRTKFEALAAKYEHAIILTTEKDAVRLELWQKELEEMELLGRIFVLGVEVGFWDREGLF
ncbi:MAG: tetraacyldisaccharide 4'-kinase [Chitinophagales bacterium]